MNMPMMMVGGMVAAVMFVPTRAGMVIPRDTVMQPFAGP
jgi:hypothetical protein